MSTGTTNIVKAWFNNSTLQVSSNTTITDTYWHHVAIVGCNNLLTMYVDGIFQNSTDRSSSTLSVTTGNVRIGLATGGTGFIGYLQGLRIDRSIVRYTGNFTPTAYNNSNLIPPFPNTTSPYITKLYQGQGFNVWDSNYVGVYHLNQNPISSVSTTGVPVSIVESTINGHTGTMTAGTVYSNRVESELGAAIYFNGSNSCVTIPVWGASNYSIGTYEFTADKYGTVAYFQSIIGSSMSGGTDYTLNVYIDSSSSLTFSNLSTYVSGVAAHTGPYVDINKAIHGSMTLNTGGVVTVNNLVSGASQSYTYANAVIAGSSSSTLIGQMNTTTRNWSGVIPEVRISNIVRSSDWMNMTYLSNSDQLASYYFNFTITSSNENALLLRIPAGMTSTTLTNFPVTLNISASSGTNNINLTDMFDVLGASYNKLYVTDSSGNQCYIEVEIWDTVYRYATLHIKVNTIYASSDTLLTLNYANTNSTNTYIGTTGTTAAQNVWDSNYLGVYHLSAMPVIGSATVLDSTANANHGTPFGTYASSSIVTSQLGRMLLTDGTTNYITLPAGIAIQFSKYTCECLVNMVSTSSGNSILVQNDFGILNQTNNWTLLKSNNAFAYGSSIILNTLMYVACVTR